jgi:hypothetical protein
MVVNNGALGALNTGVVLHGRAFTTTGALSTMAITAVMPAGCTTNVSGITQLAAENSDAVTIYPNPFTTSITIAINDVSLTNNSELAVYNVLGQLVINDMLTKQVTTLNSKHLPSGIYFYKVMSAGKTIKTGSLIAQ